jgi:hypothetical protein
LNTLILLCLVQFAKYTKDYSAKSIICIAAILCIQNDDVKYEYYYKQLVQNDDLKEAASKALSTVTQDHHFYFLVRQLGDSKHGAAKIFCVLFDSSVSECTKRAALAVLVFFGSSEKLMSLRYSVRDITKQSILSEVLIHLNCILRAGDECALVTASCISTDQRGIPSYFRNRLCVVFGISKNSYIAAEAGFDLQFEGRINREDAIFCIVRIANWDNLVSPIATRIILQNPFVARDFLDIVRRDMDTSTGEKKELLQQLVFAIENSKAK